MTRKEFLKTIKKYRKGTASAEEKRFIEAYYDLLGMQEGVDEKEMDERQERMLLYKVWTQIGDKERKSTAEIKPFVNFRNVAVAVIFFVAAGTIFYLLNNKQQATHDNRVAVSKRTADITPAGQKAVLTLGNGQKVLLGNKTSKSLPAIAKQDSGELIYQNKPESSSGQVNYNTLTTPRGGEFKIVLSDGTRVWLNAGSSLHYPVTFNGEERAVQLEGEAYFEVVQQEDHPFVVKVGKSEIQVLGTKFNVKAYRESSAIKTTLAEGKVRVVIEDKSRLLRPGEQATIDRGMPGITVKKVNVDAALAWTNDLFYFDATNIKEIMHELSRWYDVNVAYSSEDLKKLNFSGVMSRYSDFQAVLKRLSLTGTVRFDVQGRKVIVTK